MQSPLKLNVRLNTCMGPNNPHINRIYNYVYCIRNNINGMEYTGVHRTDKLNDGYMGSGKIIKRAIKKYGEKNFTKEILAFFTTYIEALNEERKIVTSEYINRKDTYNVREGGFGRCEWSDEHRKEFSEYKKKQWQNKKWRNNMLKKAYTSERAKKISAALSGRPRINPQNKDPRKIYKTALAHTGMVRSIQARKNMSIAALNAPSDVKERRSGIGCMYIHNSSNGEVKRCLPSIEIPAGWLRGTGIRKRNNKNG